MDVTPHERVCEVQLYEVEERLIPMQSAMFL